MTVARVAGESPEYAKARDELQRAEMELRDQRERVAALRRALPEGQSFEDVTLTQVSDGAVVPLQLSELFVSPDKPLVLLHFMYGKAQSQPCPMCTMWADGYDGVVEHLSQRVNFAVCVAGDPAAFEAYARSRGWRNVRIVSAADSDLKLRLGFETDEGAQHPGVSVFERDEGGGLVHTYSQSAWYGGEEFRGMDLLSPVWSFFDLIRAGRGEFFPRKSYAEGGS